MKTVYLYCDERSLNDATIYYVEIVKDALSCDGFEMKIVHRLDGIRRPKIIFTITERYFFQAKLRFPLAKTIYWSQGVASEEAKWGNRPWWAVTFKSITEYMAIRSSTFQLLVSEKMLQYNKERYGYHGDNYLIMPCFNKTLSGSFDLDQYASPRFVYAGNAAVWQAVDLLLDVFSVVEKSIPEASLTILSKDEDVFLKKIKERDIRNYAIKYVQLQDMDDELHKYKYGFILREDHIVNNVATPTKMNTYLSNYVIPIYSDSVDDFARNIKLGRFSVMSRCPLNASEIAAQIVEFEKNISSFSEYEAVVRNVFNSHYNREGYVAEIAEKIAVLF